LNKTGTAFRSELASLITRTQTHNTTYNELKNVYKTSDADPNKSGNIIWFYTGTSIPYSGTLGSGSGATNREHVWPKNGGKAFPEESEAGSDAHHLRPTEATLNSTRQDNSFGEVPQTTGNIVDEAGRTNYPNLCYQANSTFYPGEGYRGATARILMYVQTRWGDDYNLEFVLGNGSNKTIGDIEDLMKWHLLEPPTEAEKTRNEVVFGIQGNRNPFIDHPEYAEMIYCYDGQSYNDELQAVVAQYGSYLDKVTDPNVDVESITLSSTQNTLIVGESINLTASITPANASSELTWTSSNPTVASVENGKITALSAGTATITATSVKTPSVKATATVNVKALSAISITGTTSKTTYTAGESFNPAGLTVTATYSDLSTAVIPNAQVQWLDGTTRATTLSMGTTTVIAKYGTIEKTITGISVSKSTTQSISITRNSFSTSGTTYGWNNWSAGGISGQAFMYPGNKNTIQMNNGKTAYFLFSNSALPGDLVSITIKTTDTSGSTSVSKTWEVRTSNTPFSQTNGKTSAGTSRGTITSSAEGGTLAINTSDKYFAINYTGSGATYIKEIIIVYTVGADIEECQHSSSDWIPDTPSTCKVAGTRHKECTLCGETLDSESLPLADHKYVAGTPVAPTCTTEGYTLHTCSVCGKSVKKDVESALGHNYGDWTSNGDGTHTRICSNDASHKETNNCSG
ncbi:MAG: endonuclease, partial [Clostridia bacterium]|nr:endonuclease [Clostridia bacterium]